MAVIDRKKIRWVLREKLKTVPGIPADKFISAENRDYKPSSVTDLWIRETMLPAIEQKAATGMVQAYGIVQYDVIGAWGKGTEAVEDLAVSIVNTFEPGTHIVSQGIQIAIDRSEPLPGGPWEEGVWWFVPVSIRWRTYASTTI